MGLGFYSSIPSLWWGLLAAPVFSIFLIAIISFFS